MSHSSRIRKRHNGGSHFGRFALLAALFILALAATAGGVAASWIVRTANSAPPLSSLKQRDPGSISAVYSDDGTLLSYLQDINMRQPVASKDIPQVLKNAVVAIEDERFFKHKGVDYEGLVRAAVKNAVSKKTVQGGSTLTMQLVRLLYTEDYTRGGLDGIKRKLREAKLANELEQAHSKDWVLAKYINSVPYGTIGGQSAYGAEAASRMYFNKSIKHLTLIEAAMLAGMPQAPSSYSPVDYPARTKVRRNEVLTKMAELKMISPQEAAVAKAKGLGLEMDGYYQRKRESFFVEYVKSELIKEYGREAVLRGGLKVYTTIDLKKQREARAAIQSQMGAAGPSSAIVSIDPKNGDIVTMASSAEYGDSNFNLAAQGHRQPGSVFKVMTLMTALRQGVNPDSTHYVSKSPIEFASPPCGSPASPWTVKTYGGKGAGGMNLRQATLASDNSIYAQLASDLGPDKVKETARMLGITSKLNGFCAETLGGLERGVSPLEVANAYATIADGGYRNRPRAIRKVVFPDGHSELPKRWKVKRTKAFEDGMTYEATKILEANIQGGTGTKAAIGCPAGGKTGTTDHNTDAWFAGFTPRLATAVWVGYPSSNAVFMNHEFFGGAVDGGTFPSLIWGAYMKQAVGGYCGDFPQPKQPFSSIPFTGHFANSGDDEDEEKDADSPPGTTDQTSPDATDDQDPGAKPDGDGNGNGNGGGNGGGGGGGGNVDPGAGGGTGADNGGTTFDPGQYETPPQGPPATQAPAPGDGTPP